MMLRYQLCQRATQALNVINDHRLRGIDSCCRETLADNPPFPSICCISLGQHLSFRGKHGSIETNVSVLPICLNKEEMGWRSLTQLFVDAIVSIGDGREVWVRGVA